MGRAAPAIHPAAACALLPSLTLPPTLPPFPFHSSRYFGLGPQDISNRIAAAFNDSGYAVVSDNEHIYYVSPQLRQQLSAQPLPRPEDMVAPPSC